MAQIWQGSLDSLYMPWNILLFRKRELMLSCILRQTLATTSWLLLASPSVAIDQVRPWFFRSSVVNRILYSSAQHLLLQKTFFSLQVFRNSWKVQSNLSCQYLFDAFYVSFLCELLQPLYSVRSHSNFKGFSCEEAIEFY